MQETNSETGLTPSQQITHQIEGLPDWRGELLARLHELVHEAAPGIIEEWKWETNEEIIP
jgi:hypothetical protein